jgi:hypothetical protein
MNPLRSFGGWGACWRDLAQGQFGDLGLEMGKIRLAQLGWEGNFWGAEWVFNYLNRFNVIKFYSG